MRLLFEQEPGTNIVHIGHVGTTNTWCLKDAGEWRRAGNTVMWFADDDPGGLTACPDCLELLRKKVHAFEVIGHCQVCDGG